MKLILKTASLIFFILLSVCNLRAQSQNLLPNGSFENLNNWSNSIMGMQSTGTPFIYSRSNLTAPDNIFGTQIPRTGNTYAGVFPTFYSTASHAYIGQYLQAILSTPLEAGRIYYLEMYVSHADSTRYATNHLGMYVSMSPLAGNVTITHTMTPHTTRPQIIVEESGWAQISGFYVAQGGERYLTIGGFGRYDSLYLSDNRKITPPHYYIDDVSIVAYCDIPKPLLPPDTLLCGDRFTPIQLKPIRDFTAKYTWNTGDTISISSAKAPGQYILTATTHHCSVSDTQIVSFQKKPTVRLGNDTSVCNTDLVLVASGTNGLSYRWNIPATDTFARVQVSGTYIIEATEKGCTSHDSQVVTIHRIDSFSLGKDIRICANTGIIDLKLPESTQHKYLWSTFETTRQIITAMPGIYWGELYSGTCRVRDSIEIKFITPPIVDLGNDTSLCFEVPLRISASGTWQKLWSDGSTGSFIDVTQPGLYWLTSYNDSCVSSDSILIVRLPHPIISLGNDRLLCNDEETMLRVVGDTASLTWNTGQLGQEISARAPGVYYVKAINSFGCTSSDTIRLDTFTSPRPYLGSDTTLCAGDTIVLDAGVFDSYLWNTGSAQQRYTVSNSGTFVIRVTDTNGCAATDSISLIVHNRPLLSLPQQLRVCDPDTLIVVQSSPGNRFLWSDGTSSASNLVTSYGKLSVMVTDSNQCSQSATIDVVNSCRGKISIPNAFTPGNGDNTNDVFIPVMRNIRSVHMQVYTRWGELIFETSDMNDGWDGTHRKQPAQQDVYVYIINYTDIQGLSGSLNGSVTLLR